MTILPKQNGVHGCLRGKMRILPFVPVPNFPLSNHFKPSPRNAFSQPILRNKISFKNRRQKQQKPRESSQEKLEQTKAQLLEQVSLNPNPSTVKARNHYAKHTAKGQTVLSRSVCLFSEYLEIIGVSLGDQFMSFPRKDLPVLPSYIPSTAK